MVRSLLFTAAFYIGTVLILLCGGWLLLAPRSWAMEGLRLHGLFYIWLLRVICGTELEIRGRERIPRDGCLIVSKHQSTWDTFGLIPLFRDPAVVLKDELKWIPLYGWFCMKFAHIRVRRDKAARALKALIRDARACIAAGRQVVIFPEGTRMAPGSPANYQVGYVALYEALAVPAIPIALNSGLFWPRRSLRRYPGRIIVEVLEPIPPGLPRKQFRALIEARIEDATRRLIDEAAAGANPPPLAVLSEPEARGRVETERKHIENKY